RVPELIRSIPVAQVEFAAKTAERLGRTLQREDLSEFIHYQAASALTVLAQSIAAFEDFQDVLAIALSLEASNNRNPEKHKKCCGMGIVRLVPPSAIERIIELYLMQRQDSMRGKTTTTLLRIAAPASIESVFARLIADTDARNRLALVRLAGQLGKGSIEVARRYLGDERWYVVRNMCGVLAELKDPNLVEDISPALEHGDSRVQQAALKALVKSRSARAASVLAGSLAKLNPDILDEALDELMFLKNASAITALEGFVTGRGVNLACLKKAVQALGAIADEAALDALTRLFRTEELERSVRHAALLAISSHRSSRTLQLLEELATSWGPLTEEARKELERRKSR
ncbi:MAG: HEAT repeat domain-containing protein, partial [Acidobacteria bacterium]|nr:HEAT repeat domain-containing protein [Acidobacteriota bacterium]